MDDLNTAHGRNVAADMKLFPISARLWKFNFTAHEQYQTNTAAERAQLSNDAVSKGNTAHRGGVRGGGGGVGGR